MPDYIQIRLTLKYHIDNVGNPLCGIKSKGKNVFQEIIPGCENPDRICKRCLRIKKKSRCQKVSINQIIPLAL
jgi:hypothetical protein